MEAKKTKKTAANEGSQEPRYSVKKDPQINICSAGAVAMEDASRIDVQD